ncbi:MAG: hypothetical protein QOI38_3131 [Sphingomonadales bacterium]|jgi:hypothetical protein|nr:hypothetical protein [Sphingomonadales bacterium]
MRYRTNHHVGYAGKIHDPETLLTFKPGDEAIRDRLLEVGAIVEDKSQPAPPPAPPAPPAAPKPLAEQPLEELKLVGKAEGIRGWNLWKDPAKAVAAIERHRAEKVG